MSNQRNTPATGSEDDQAVIAAGYKPQLKRSLGFFSSFAVSFSFMSILLGVFSAYGFVLTKAGPFGFWTWPLVAIGQTFVALVFAEMATRIPLTGALYNWNTRLTNPTIGWLTAWMLIFAYSVAAAGIVVAMMAPLQTLLGQEFGPDTTRLIGVGIIVLQTIINVYGVQITATINKLAVIAEIVALFVFGLILLAVVLMRGEANTALLTTIPASSTYSWTGFLMASLLGAWTIFGFESPSDLSEETVDAKHVVPKSIVSSVIATGILGFVFIVILTLAIPDLTAVTASSDPASMIITHHLGGMPTKLFLMVVLLAMFATTMMNITAAARVLFAVARDKRIAGSSFLVRVSGHKVPKTAILAVSVIEILAIIFCQSMTDLFAAPTVLLTLAYLVTVISFVLGYKKVSPAGHLLSSKYKIIATLAIVWLVSEIAILTLPEEFHSSSYIAAGILAVGIVFSWFVRPRPTSSK